MNALLAGPRGRRLCLELVSELDPRVRAAVFELGYELDPGKGMSVVLFGPGAGASRVIPSPQELAALLVSVDLSRVDAELVFAALESTVLTAMYWQPPDGVDVLAALPAIQEALGPVAARVADAAPHLGRPRRTEQWAIDWREPDDPAPLGSDLRQALERWSRNIRMDEARALEAAREVRSNWSGSWWSIPSGLLSTVGCIPAGLSLVEDAPGWHGAVTIPVRGTGRTFEIHTAEDWVHLCRRHPLGVTASRRHDWFRVTGRDGRWVIPDWEGVADEWDAVHLTVEGYLSSAGRALEVDAERASVIAGWDPDRTIWLSDVVRETGPRQFWHRAQQGDLWRQST
ncbi:MULTISPECIES: hypothetical protein [unclassified Arthrobacter]|uniref:hypothetical protein n=1 Tax=unclassified Arthrobacter TaxID=235627 RepID=UPI0024E04034|nr:MULTISPECIES: hypothetical protein [unclassified Arthrobacter]MCC9145714.1 hypothetical protein [Arthrobacter sp. zg-Y919]MDK1276943.1 hypothetical protein [Arthrobacter sp. zg.Y919]WIB04126.1 hypothetical protein QNO10_05570 [Arthrobacter sp. zg-Y919]